MSLHTRPPIRAINYADWGLRAEAATIDAVMLWPFNWVLRFVPLVGAGITVHVVASLVYLVVFGIWNGEWGQTPGKLAAKIQVKDAKRPSQTIGIGRGIVRELVAGLLWVTLIGGIIDLLWQRVDPKKRTLHDRLVGAIVVKVRFP